MKKGWFTNIFDPNSQKKRCWFPKFSLISVMEFVEHVGCTGKNENFVPCSENVKSVFFTNEGDIVLFHEEEQGGFSF